MVFINGKMASSGASGGIEQADDYNLVSTMEIDLPDIDTSGTVDMEIRYWVEDKEIGTISFTASGAELLADTVTIPLNEVITLPDDQHIIPGKIHYQRSRPGKSSSPFLPKR